MAKKRKAYVHVGPGGDILESALAHHRSALAELGVNVPAKSVDESFRAAIEILRDHKAWGFRRSEVEGAWADVYRRAWKGKATIAVSLPLLARATPEQVELFLDGLHGFEVHVVVTGERAPKAWAAAVTKPEEHLHMLRAADEAALWKAFGKLVGFGTASLGLDDVPRPVASQPLDDLATARRELEKLARRNSALEVRLATSEAKRRKWKRRAQEQDVA